MQWEVGRGWREEEREVEKWGEVYKRGRGDREREEWQGKGGVAGKGKGSRGREAHITGLTVAMPCEV